MEQDNNIIDTRLRNISEKLKEIGDRLATGTYEISDIVKTYAAIYNALSQYYEQILKKPLPQKVYSEYVETLKKDLEKKIKQLEDKYITIELKGVDETGKTLTKKVNVNAALLLDILTDKFGSLLWEYLAIRLPPPELYIIMLQHMEVLYSRLSVHEALLKEILEIFVSLNDTLIEFSKNIEELNKRLKELDNLLNIIKEKYGRPI